MAELGLDYVRIGEFAWSPAASPSRGGFDWDWLDRAIDTLAQAGLKIVLGTPTARRRSGCVDDAPGHARRRRAGPPARLRLAPPLLLLATTATGRNARRIVDDPGEALRQPSRPSPAGRPTMNMAATTRCSPIRDAATAGPSATGSPQVPVARAAERGLGQCLLVDGDHAASTRSSLPNLTVTEANPRPRWTSAASIRTRSCAFNRMQCEILRAHSPGRWITHNFMGFFNDFDHCAVGADLDRRSLGQLSARLPRALSARRDGREEPLGATAHPDIAAFHHDLYRGVGRGRWWVMEQQPGPVNWAPWNPVPLPRHGAAVDLGGLRPRRRGGELLPLAAGPLRAGADARGPQLGRPARTLAGRPRGCTGRSRVEVARSTSRLGPRVRGDRL